MKILVIGKGLAAMGLIEALLDKGNSSLEIHWVGPAMDDLGWANCSRNSTAVVAAHGVKRGLSPLGDDLYSAFEKTRDFISKYKPDGVRTLHRSHFCDSPDGESFSKLKRRFGEVQKIDVFGKSLWGVEEDAFVFSPSIYMKWWANRLLKDKRVVEFTDYIVALDSSQSRGPIATGLKSAYEGERLYDCRGSSSESVEKVPGHFWVFPLGEFDKDCVLSFNGHNLILDKNRGVAILGGSTELNDLSAPSVGGLTQQMKSFTQILPELESVLRTPEATIHTGLRPKGPRRRPVVKEQAENHIEINGLYKNGYSLCHLLGERGVNSL